MGKHNFKELKAWQNALSIVPMVYKLVLKFPEDEKFALTSQIKRAVVSISSNIAEGSGRGTNKDFAHFLDFALGSSYELESELLVAVELNYITLTNCDEIFNNLIEIQRLITGFQKTLR
ncbi:MAG: four helix bundle protein [Salinivirgaceae bacterium]